MKRLTLICSAMFLASATVLAQPPGVGRRAGPGGPGGGPDGRPGGRPGNLVVEALDADHDGEISESEIKNASIALASLDKNKDGKLTEEEFRPPRPEGAGPGWSSRSWPQWPRSWSR